VVVDASGNHITRYFRSSLSHHSPTTGTHRPRPPVLEFWSPCSL